MPRLIGIPPKEMPRPRQPLPNPRGYLWERAVILGLRPLIWITRESYNLLLGAKLKMQFRVIKRTTKDLNDFLKDHLEHVEEQ